MISLKQLQVFSSIARHGNLGLAAAELFLSKGALSQALAELERQLGHPVFDRVHPRLQLNDQGRQLQPLAEEVLSRITDIEHLFDEQGAPSGSLRLGASQTIGNYLLPKLLAQQPQLQAKVRITNTHNLCDMLLRFELDMALIEGENFHPTLVTQDWLQDEMLVIAHPHHPLAEKKTLKLAQLAHHNWVLREPKSGNREQFDRELTPQIGTLGQTLELNTLEAVMQAAEQGLGLAFVSRRAVSDRLTYGRLVTINVNTYLSRTLKLVWHKQKYHSALLRRFIALCQQYDETKR
ncbi:LysR substrate-binding domain-containing protein [Oceanisphaera sp. IT1-181]|uniref:LysR substrate-binding domain-containing protein n=1 Tax=Oceanisphaera sp. IT1-181 TaxID=3081199 RepID=UPI0029CAA7F7|nr:LysR substrate-binding domain-containing protein [Oceanisphaera sp. IT1-181]